MQIPVLKNKIEYFLNDPGLQLRHPNKEDIVLEDIFIFPDLSLDNQRVINSRKLLQINKDNNKISISGIEDSGKTTLFKVLIKHYLNSGYHPVYIDAQSLTITDPNEILEIIDRSYEDMYEPDSLERIRIGSSKKKAVFIDNFDKASNDIRVLCNVLNTLYNEFGNLILSEETTYNIFKYDQLKTLYPALSEEINRYEIMDFSDQLQLELIDKWQKLKNIKEPDIESFSSKTEKIKKIFNTIIENNLVPSLPVFFLTILQSNSENEANLVSGSSYSHYYEYLTLKSIANFIDNHDLEFYLQFLAELSYYLFKEHRVSVSYAELNHVYDLQIQNKEKTQSLELVIESLIKADTLMEETVYYFKYKYIYHYFVARYLSTNIELESVKKQIKYVFSELYNEDFAHIVLFLTHLSDDTLIINELLLRTKSTFSEETIFSKEEDLHEIDELIEELSRLGTKDRKLKEIPTKYIASSINAGERLKVAHNLLKIVKEVLRNRKNKDNYTKSD